MEESEMDLALGALNAAIESMQLTMHEDSTKKQFTLKKYTPS